MHRHNLCVCPPASHTHTHAPPQPVCLPPSQPTFTGRRSDVHYLLFRIAQNTAVAGTGSIVMDANMISLSGGFGQVVFETTAGTFGGADLGCSATRAWRSAGSSVAFTPPADGVFTIRALYASGYGAVSVAAEYVAGDSCLEDSTGDGLVDVNDLLALLAAFGQTCGDNSCLEDSTGDGLVDVNDLLALLAAFGQTCGDSTAGSGR